MASYLTVDDLESISDDYRMDPGFFNPDVPLEVDADLSPFDEAHDFLGEITLIGKFPIPIVQGLPGERKAKVVSMVDSYAKDS